jgi:hypothetical protein
MAAQISIFSAKNLNGPEDYIPYQNCMTYIKQKSSVIPYSGKGQETRLELMKNVGMKNYSKFYRRRWEWDNLIGRVPLSYLDAISVDMNILSYCLEMDNEAYIKALGIERKVAYVSVRLGPCVYTNIKTPEEYQNEKDAIEFYNSIMLNPKVDFSHLWIRFPGIIHHSFTRGHGYESTVYYYPSFIIDRYFLIAKRASNLFGITWV